MLRFIKALFLFTVSLPVLWAADSFFVFVPDAKSKQVHSLQVSEKESNVAVGKLSSITLPFGPNRLAPHPDGRHLFVVSGGKESSSMAKVEIGEKGGGRLVASATLNHPCGYVSIDRNGRFLLSSHYGLGIVAAYQIEEGQHFGKEASSLKAPRKETHSILTTRDNRYAYVPCVKNNNALYQFSFDEESGGLEPLEPFNALPPAMFGPRHLAYHPSLDVVYFSNEQQLGVSVYEIGNNGQLRGLQHAMTLPRRSPFVLGKRDLHASDLALTPDGQLLFVAVRDFNGEEDSVFSFRVGEEGKLSLLKRTRVGDVPAKLNVSPSGKTLVVSESGVTQLSIFSIQSDGGLKRHETVDLPAAATGMTVFSLK